MKNNGRLPDGRFLPSLAMAMRLLLPCLSRERERERERMCTFWCCTLIINGSFTAERYSPPIPIQNIFFLSLHLIVCLLVHSLVSLDMSRLLFCYLSIFSSVWLSLCLSVRFPSSLSICLSVCLSVVYLS